jgi:hypothetical protein
MKIANVGGGVGPPGPKKSEPWATIPRVRVKLNQRAAGSQLTDSSPLPFTQGGQP